MNELINKAIEAFNDNYEKVPTRDILSKVLTAALTICKTAGNADVWDSLSEEEKEGAVLFVCRDICRSFSNPATMAGAIATSASRNAEELKEAAPERWEELDPTEKACACCYA